MNGRRAVGEMRKFGRVRSDPNTMNSYVKLFLKNQKMETFEGNL